MASKASLASWKRVLEEWINELRPERQERISFRDLSDGSVFRAILQDTIKYHVKTAQDPVGYFLKMEYPGIELTPGTDEHDLLLATLLLRYWSLNLKASEHAARTLVCDRLNVETENVIRDFLRNQLADAERRLGSDNHITTEQIYRAIDSVQVRCVKEEFPATPCARERPARCPGSLRKFMDSPGVQRQKALAESQRQLRVATSELDQEQAARTALEHELVAQTNKTRKLEAQLKSSAEYAAKLEDDLLKLQEDDAKRETDHRMRDLKEQVKTLRAELSSLEAKYLPLEDQHEILEAKYEKLQEASKAVKTLSEDQARIIEGLQQDIQAMDRTLAEKTELCNELQAFVNGMRNSCDVTFDGDMSASGSNSFRLMGSPLPALDTLPLSSTVVDVILQEKIAELGEIKGRFDSAARKVSDVLSSRDCPVSPDDGLACGLEALANILEGQDAKLAENASEMSRLAEDRQKMEADLRDSRAEIGAMLQRCEQYDKEVSKLNCAVAEKVALLSQADLECQQLAAKLSSTEERGLELGLNLAEAARELTEMKSAELLLKESLSQTQAQLTEEQDTLERVRSELETKIAEKEEEVAASQQNCQQLSEALQASENNVVGKTSELTALNNKHELALQENQTLGQNLAEASRELTELRNSIVSKGEEIASSEHRCQQLSEALQVSENNVVEKNSELAALKNENELVMQENQTLGQNLAEAARELTEKQDTLELVRRELETKICEKGEEIAASQLKCQQLSEALQVSENSVVEKNSELAVLTGQHELALQENQTLGQNLVETEALRVELEGKIGAKEEEMAVSQQNCEKLSEALLVSESTIVEKNSELVVLTGQHELVLQENQTLTQNLAEAGRELTEMKSTELLLKESLSQTSAQLTEEQDTLERVRSETEALRVELEGKICEKVAEISAAQQNCQQLSEALQVSENNVEEKNSELSALNNKHELLLQENQTLGQNLAEAARELAEKQDTLELVRRELETKICEKEEEIAASQRNCQQLSEALQVSENNVVEKNSELAVLTGQHELALQENQTLTQNLAETEALRVELEGKIGAKEEEITGLRNTQRDLQQELDVAREAIAEKQLRNDNTEKELQATNGLLAAANDELKMLGESLEKKQLEVEELVERCDQYDSEVAELWNSIGSKKEEIAGSQQNCQQLAEALQVSENNVVEKNSELAALNNKHELVLQDFKAAELQLLENQAHIVAISEKCEDLGSQLNNVSEERNKQTEDFLRLEAKMLESRAEHEATVDMKNKEIADIETERNQLRVKHAEALGVEASLKASLHQTEGEVASLTEEYCSLQAEVDSSESFTNDIIAQMRAILAQDCEFHGENCDAAEEVTGNLVHTCTLKPDQLVSNVARMCEKYRRRIAEDKSAHLRSESNWNDVVLRVNEELSCCTERERSARADNVALGSRLQAAEESVAAEHETLASLVEDLVKFIDCADNSVLVNSTALSLPPQTDGFQRLLSKLGQLRESISILAANRSCLFDDFCHVKEQLKVKVDEWESLMTRVDTLTESCDGFRTESESSAEKCRTLREELAAVESATVGLKMQTRALQSRNAELVTDLSRKMQCCFDWETASVEISKFRSSIVEITDRFLASKNAFIGQLEDIRRTYDGLKSCDLLDTADVERVDALKSEISRSLSSIEEKHNSETLDVLHCIYSLLNHPFLVVQRETDKMNGKVVTADLDVGSHSEVVATRLADLDTAMNALLAEMQHIPSKIEQLRGCCIVASDSPSDQSLFDDSLEETPAMSSKALEAPLPCSSRCGWTDAVDPGAAIVQNVVETYIGCQTRQFRTLAALKDEVYSLEKTNRLGAQRLDEALASKERTVEEKNSELVVLNGKHELVLQENQTLGQNLAETEALRVELEGKIGDKEEEITVLCSTQGDLRQELDVAREVIAEKQLRNDNTERELQTTNELLAAANDELKMLGESLRSAQAETEKKQLEVVKLVELCDQYDSKVAELRNSIGEKKEEIAAAEHKCQELSEALLVSENNVVEKNSELAVLTGQHELALQENQTLGQNLAETEALRVELEGKIVQKEEEMAASQLKCQQLSETLQASESCVVEKNSELAVLTGQHELVLQENQTLGQNLAEAGRELTELRNSIASKEEEIASSEHRCQQLSEALQVSENNVVEKNKELAALNNKHELLLQDFKAAELQLLENQAHIVAISEKCDELCSQLNNVSEERNKQTEDFLRLEAKMLESRAEHEATVDMKNKEIADIETERNQLRVKHAEALGVEATLKASLHQTEGEVASLTEENCSLKTEVDSRESFMKEIIAEMRDILAQDCEFYGENCDAAEEISCHIGNFKLDQLVSNVARMCEKYRRRIAEDKSAHLRSESNWHDVVMRVNEELSCCTERERAALADNVVLESRLQAAEESVAAEYETLVSLVEDLVKFIDCADNSVLVNSTGLSLPPQTDSFQRLLSKLGQLRESISILAANKSCLFDDFCHVKEQLKVKVDEWQSLMTRVDTLTESCDGFKAESESSAEKCRTAEAAVAGLREELAAVESTTVGLKMQTRALQSRNAELVTDLSRKMRCCFDWETAGVEISKFRSLIAEITDRFLASKNAFEGQLEDIRRTYDGLKSCDLSDTADVERVDALKSEISRSLSSIEEKHNSSTLDVLHCIYSSLNHPFLVVQRETDKMNGKVVTADLDVGSHSEVVAARLADLDTAMNAMLAEMQHIPSKIEQLRGCCIVATDSPSAQSLFDDSLEETPATSSKALDAPCSDRCGWTDAVDPGAAIVQNVVETFVGCQTRQFRTLAALKDEVYSLEKTNRLGAQRLEEALASKEVLQATIEEQQASVAQLKQDYNALLRDCEQAQGDANRFREQLARNDEQFRAVQERTAQLELETKRLDDLAKSSYTEEQVRVKVEKLGEEYDGKLTRMKDQMRDLFRKETAKFDDMKAKACAETERLSKIDSDKQISKYKAHIQELTQELDSLTNKFQLETLQTSHLEKQKARLQAQLAVHTAALQPDPLAARHEQVLDHLQRGRSDRVVRTQTTTTFERDVDPTSGYYRRQTIASQSTVSSVRHLPSESFAAADEEGEVFNNTYLGDLKAGRLQLPAPPTDDDRFGELRYRNSLCPPHLKSSYPAETQFADPRTFRDDEMKLGFSSDVDHSDTSSLSALLLPSERQRKRDRGKNQTSYQKPGPPTPIKNGGRRSLQGGELLSPRAALREVNDGARSKVATPNRIMQMFKGKRDENSPVTPRNRRLSLFRKSARGREDC